jgi:hypothetical protein
MIQKARYGYLKGFLFGICAIFSIMCEAQTSHKKKSRILCVKSQLTLH